jgi:hypothetical protein
MTPPDEAELNRLRIENDALRQHIANLNTLLDRWQEVCVMLRQTAVSAMDDHRDTLTKAALEPDKKLTVPSLEPFIH